MLNKIKSFLGLTEKPKRLELRFVNYSEGDRLIREGWKIADEEDNNRVIGWIYLERLEESSDGR